MAKMVPPYFSQKCVSPGEKALFKKFRDDSNTKNWTILHSLGVAKHSKRIQGEIDFVILIPSEGILCIEVKAGAVRRVDGVWEYGQEPNITKSYTGPFVQASDGMHEIRDYLARKAPSLKSLLVFSGVFFTGIYFDEESPEWHSWQYADVGALSRLSAAECCLNLLRHAHEYIKTRPSAKWYDPERSRPTAEQINLIFKILRSNFEYSIDPASKYRILENEFIKYTKEQFRALDLLEENNRIIFKGPAGTGKTVLALEAAKRSITSGKRTLFVCFNNLLGKWLKSEASSLRDEFNGDLDCGTFHSILLKLTGMKSPKNINSDFWKNVLPEKITEMALDETLKSPLWEMLVIDEAQDLLTPNYLDVLDLLVEGGLKDGKWVMFGDFERQNIYSDQSPYDEKINALETLKEYSSHYFSVPLRNNCRNPRQIADCIELVSNLQPGYSKVLVRGTDNHIDIHYYGNNIEQKKLLIDTIVSIRKSTSDGDIVILSFNEDRRSCAHNIENEIAVNLLPAKNPFNKNTVKYSSIHSYKGLESPFVILTDIDRIEGEKSEALLYIGMSRAKHHLTILMNKKCKSTYLDKIKQSYLT